MDLKSIDPVEFLCPENDLEKMLILEEDFNKGLFWGEPRYGHPEGKVIFHIREVYSNINKLKISAELRSKLRIIALVHDTFKYKEAEALHKDGKRDWSKHHSILAAQFLSKFIDDQEILKIVKYHDEAYYSWRTHALDENIEESQTRLSRLQENIGDDIQLFYLFFKCDTRTGDKIQTPVRWFERRVPNIKVVDF
ncbi:MAG: HD domain-containing protein [Saprospiraceae bacterium]|nr:HD domain-containing protein [Saprospiraceae bacterium]